MYWDRSGKILSVLLASDNQVKYENNKIEISSLRKNCYFIKGKVHVIEGGISSNGRALALHVRGTGIDTRILQIFSLIQLSGLGITTCILLIELTFSYFSMSAVLICVLMKKIQKGYMQIFKLKHIKYENSFGYCCSPLLMASIMSC